VRPLRLPHAGVAAARNGALDAPGGHEYIAFLDSDDEWRPGHLAPMVRALADDPTLVGAFSLPSVVDSRGEVLGAELRASTAQTLRRMSVSAQPPVHRLDQHAFQRLQVRGEFSPSPSTVVLRASHAAGLRFNTSRFILEDCEYLLVLAGRGPFVFVDDPRVVMRRLGDNLTGDAVPSTDVALRRWRAVLDYEHWKLGQTSEPDDALAVRQKVAAAAYMIGQGLADRGDLAGARRAYLDSLRSVPGALAAKGFAASCLPEPVRRAVLSLLGR
jgi:glycosyltransferase involved in cell wall biosynthesis